MSDVFDGPPGSTPIEPDDREGLIPTWVATRADLNSAEQENISQAVVWLGGRRWKLSDIDAKWLTGLHRRMFGHVWTWAGSFRRVDTNVGIPWAEVPSAVEELIRDVRAQVEQQAWSPDEIAVRFHHRLAFIHPFPNGNGRNARLAADVLVEALGRTRFDWGAGRELTSTGETRARYISALRHADQEGEIQLLLAFARTPD